MTIGVRALYDEATSTLTYVVFDHETRDAVVIDAVLDFDAASGKTSLVSVGRVMDVVRELSLRVHWILETHAHADHLSGAQVLAANLGAGIGIGAHIRDVQAVFKGVFDLGDGFATDGSQFDRLFGDGEVIEAGALRVRVIHTPGHTPGCVSYVVGDAVFTGDALFMPDYGVGRCDFPGGDAKALYGSVHERLYGLSDETRVFVGHDYQPGGRAVAWESTIGASKRGNVQLRAETSQDDFVAFRQARDATLSAPKLLYPSVQVNIDAGRLPLPAANGRRYLKLPVSDPS